MLDLGGIAEPTPFCDLAAGTVSAYRGDGWGATLSYVGVLPWLGDLGKSGKLPKSFQKVYNGITYFAQNRNTKYGKMMQSVFSYACGFLEQLPIHRLPDWVGQPANAIRERLRSILGGCFAGGTPIITPDGQKAIEDVRPGDWVLSAPEENPDTSPVPRRVEEVFENFTPLLGLRIGSVKIRTTAEHPFWVDGRGWTPANQLVEGDRLRSHDGSTMVLAGIEDLPEAAPVYNMRVADFHTYFVGSVDWGFSVWVHNSYADEALKGTSRIIGANHARIDPRKLTEYALNPNHPVGGNKAKVFESALGYNQSNYEGLLTQLQKGVMENPAVPGTVDKYGARFTIDILVTGPKGSATVRSGWILKPGSTIPEMTTVFVK